MPEIEHVAGAERRTVHRHVYRCSGLRLAANRPLPGLLDDRSGGLPDLTVELASRAGPTASEGRLWRVHPVTDESGRPAVEVRRSGPEGPFQLTYADGTAFSVDRGGRRIRGSWAAPFTLEDAVTYLLGPVLGFALRLRGGIVLHASAVAIDGSAVLFLGASGAGKSTLAAALARRGHPVLCDDAAALTGDGDRMAVLPGSPRIRLWSDAAEALFGSAARLPLLTANWEKHYFDVAAIPGLFRRCAAPLGAIYLLEPLCRDGERAQLASVTPRQALHALLTHSYVGYLQDSAMRAREFERLAGLAARVPVRRLRRSAAAAQIGELCELVVRDARRAVAQGVG
ncbi:MAG: hypothetical protein V3U03_00725 [Myxococcota bacterium]